MHRTPEVIPTTEDRVRMMTGRQPRWAMSCWWTALGTKRSSRQPCLMESWEGESDSPEEEPLAQSPDRAYGAEDMAQTAK